MQVAKSDSLPELGEKSSEGGGMSAVQRAQYKAYKELKQRIERERQLAVVQVQLRSEYWTVVYFDQQTHACACIRWSKYTTLDALITEAFDTEQFNVQLSDFFCQFRPCQFRHMTNLTKHSPTGNTFTI